MSELGPTAAPPGVDLCLMNSRPMNAYLMSRGVLTRPVPDECVVPVSFPLSDYHGCRRRPLLVFLARLVALVLSSASSSSLPLSPWA